MDLAILDLRGAIDRFHRRVRQERRAVFSLDGFRYGVRGFGSGVGVAALVIGKTGFAVET